MRILILLALLISGCDNYKTQNLISKNIVGGKPIGNKKLASALVMVRLNEDITSCSGSYIGKNKVITAAHCLTAISGKRWVQFYINNYEKIFNCKVTDELTHPEYLKDEKKFWYDVAILKIDCKFSEDNPYGDKNDLLKTVFPFIFQNNQKLLSNEYFQSGYGRTNPFDIDDTDEAIFIGSKKTDYKVDFFDTHNPMYVHRNEMEKLRQKNMLLCSEASVEKSSLPGDSGGPMFNFNQEKKHILLGTISISSVKKPNDLSTIYRNCFGSINLTQKWIEENLN